uniref:Uncharacterized protein n=1 Tax=Sciurus vulgaris TaxID=55149 RepID=A0A8D2CQC0_SCIVU
FDSNSSCHKTPSPAIPATCQVAVQLPPRTIAPTPVGTLFSITPGGTRIIYDWKFLMECQNSAVTKTFPRDLPTIPGVTSPASDEASMEASQSHLLNNPEDKWAGSEESGAITYLLVPPLIQELLPSRE